MQRFPFNMVVEYRGARAPSSFVKKETGATVDLPARLKFEYARDDGDVELLEVPASQLNKIEPPFDHASLKRGDQVRLEGEVLLQPRGSDRESYPVFQRAVLVEAQPQALTRVS